MLILNLRISAPKRQAAFGAGAGVSPPRFQGEGAAAGGGGEGGEGTQVRTLNCHKNRLGKFKSLELMCRAKLEGSSSGASESRKESTSRAEEQSEQARKKYLFARHLIFHNK